MTNEYSPFQWGIGLICAGMFMWGIFHVVLWGLDTGISLFVEVVTYFQSTSPFNQVIMTATGAIFLLVVMYLVSMSAVRRDPW